MTPRPTDLHFLHPGAAIDGGEAVIRAVPPAIDPSLPAVPHELGDGRRPVVLILAPAFPPDPLSGAARPARFAKYLPLFGYEPVVICMSLPEYEGSSESVRRVPVMAPSRKARALAGIGRHVQRYLLPYNDHLPWVGHALFEAEAVLAHRRIAAVLSTSPPLGAHLVALWLKRRRGLPWVADFRDPLWGNPFRTRRWFFPYDAFMERRLFRSADALIANTDTVADLWIRRHSDIAGKVSVIWNGFDPEDQMEVTTSPSAPGSRRVLAHVGSLYGARHPGRLLSSLVRLIRRGDLASDRFCIRLVGPLDESCIRTNQEAVDALQSWGCLEYDGEHVPLAEARRAAARSDYLLLLDLNEKVADLQVPAKVFDYVRLGRPILAYTGRDSPTDRILRGSGVPYRTVYHDTGEAESDREVRALVNLPTNPVQPSPWFAEQFDGRNQTRRLAGILDLVRGRSMNLPGAQPSPLEVIDEGDTLDAFPRSRM